MHIETLFTVEAPTARAAVMSSVGSPGVNSSPKHLCVFYMAFQNLHESILTFQKCLSWSSDFRKVYQEYIVVDPWIALYLQINSFVHLYKQL